MALIADYQAKVYINDVEITGWSGIEIYKKLGEAEVNFNVKLNRPIDIADDSFITIKEGYGSSLLTVVKDKKIENAGIGMSQSTLTGNSSSLSRCSAAKSIYFVSEVWLKQRWPYYALRGGVIHRYDPKSDYKIRGISPSRLFIDELPGKNVRDVEFECVVSAGLSYHKIASTLAGKIKSDYNNIPYTVQISVPDLPLQKTFVMNSGETYFSAIMRLFAIFRPMVRISENIIYITGIAGTNQERPPGCGGLRLSEDSFSIYQYNKLTNSDLIDYVLIAGMSKNFTYKYFKPLNKLKLKGGSLQGQTIEVTTTEDHTVNGSDTYYELTKPSQNTIQKTVKKSTMKVNDNTDEMATIKEEIFRYGPDDLLMHKIVTDYEWADYNTLVKSTTNEYKRIPVEGSGQAATFTTDNSGANVVWYPCTSFKFVLVCKTVVNHKSTIEDMGLVESDKYIYKLLIYYQDKVKKDNIDYTLKQSCYAVQDALKMGIPYYEESTDSDTGWRTVLELAESESTRIDIVSPALLRRNMVNTKYHPQTASVFKSEDIPLKRKKSQDMTELRWLFIKVGNSVIQIDDNYIIPNTLALHPRVDINCPDITTSNMAQTVASIIMSSRPANDTQAMVKTTLPIPGIEVGQTIIMPTCSKEYFDWTDNSFKTIELTGQNYWVTGVKKVINFTGSWETNQRTCEMYDELELKENF